MGTRSGRPSLSEQIAADFRSLQVTPAHPEREMEGGRGHIFDPVVVVSLREVGRKLIRGCPIEKSQWYGQPCHNAGKCLGRDCTKH